MLTKRVVLCFGKAARLVRHKFTRQGALDFCETSRGLISLGKRFISNLIKDFQLSCLLVLLSAVQRQIGGNNMLGAVQQLLRQAGVVCLLVLWWYSWASSVASSHLHSTLFESVSN